MRGKPGVMLENRGPYAILCLRVACMKYHACYIGDLRSYSAVVSGVGWHHRWMSSKRNNFHPHNRPPLVHSSGRPAV